jgi:hypothetical protein
MRTTPFLHLRTELLLVLFLALALVGTTSVAAFADEFACRGTVGAVTKDNIRSPTVARARSRAPG